MFSVAVFLNSLPPESKCKFKINRFLIIIYKLQNILDLSTNILYDSTYKYTLVKKAKIACVIVASHFEELRNLDRDYQDGQFGEATMSDFMSDHRLISCGAFSHNTRHGRSFHLSARE